MITLGIDPGWASCGLALREYGKITKATNIVPRDIGSREMFGLTDITDYIKDEFLGTEFTWVSDIDAVYMERYVAYKGIHSDMSEKILMFIGALQYYFLADGVPVHMVRAIDWKPKVCKYLVRTKGFNNPYPSFDKKYSILAAKELSGISGVTDHEADAICLSYLSVVVEYNSKNKGTKK